MGVNVALVGRVVLGGRGLLPLAGNRGVQLGNEILRHGVQILPGGVVFVVDGQVHNRAVVGQVIDDEVSLGVHDAGGAAALGFVYIPGDKVVKVDLCQVTGKLYHAVGDVGFALGKALLERAGVRARVQLGQQIGKLVVGQQTAGSGLPQLAADDCEHVLGDIVALRSAGAALHAVAVECPGQRVEPNLVAHDAGHLRAGLGRGVVKRLPLHGQRGHRQQCQTEQRCGDEFCVKRQLFHGGGLLSAG